MKKWTVSLTKLLFNKSQSRGAYNTSNIMSKGELLKWALDYKTSNIMSKGKLVLLVLKWALDYKTGQHVS